MSSTIYAIQFKHQLTALFGIKICAIHLATQGVCSTQIFCRSSHLIHITQIFRHLISQLCQFDTFQIFIGLSKDIAHIIDDHNFSIIVFCFRIELTCFFKMKKSAVIPCQVFINTAQIFMDLGFSIFITHTAINGQSKILIDKGGVVVSFLFK
ncbi:hypothetical protein D3C81_1474730 [compost metagenome]